MGRERRLAEVCIGVARQKPQRRITIIDGTPSQDESEQVHVAYSLFPFFLQASPHFLSANHPLESEQVKEGNPLDTSDTAFPFTPPSPQDTRRLIDMAHGHVEESVPTPVLTKENTLLTNLGSEADNNQTKAPQSHHDDTSKTMFSHGDPEEIKTGTFVIYSSHDERTV
jgi:hypothetical protein